MRGKYVIRAVLGAALVGVLLGCEPISEPWVKGGQWGKRIEDERTRNPDQQRELERRLEYYGAAYK